jgi:hypothetical protein
VRPPAPDPRPSLSFDQIATLQKGFGYIENESFDSAFRGLFCEINLGSDKLGNVRLIRLSAEHCHTRSGRSGKEIWKFCGG